MPLEIRDPTLPAHADFPAVTVTPGDLVLADVDGVVVVPPSLAEEVLSLAQQGREVDERCMRDLRSGRGVAETFKEHRGK